MSKNKQLRAKLEASVVETAMPRGGNPTTLALCKKIAKAMGVTNGMNGDDNIIVSSRTYFKPFDSEVLTISDMTGPRDGSKKAPTSAEVKAWQKKIEAVIKPDYSLGRTMVDPEWKCAVYELIKA